MYPVAGQFDGVMGPDGEGPGLKPSTAVSSNAAASPVTAAQATDGEMMLSLGGGRGGNTTPKPINKTGWNRDTKVSQGTVNSVKDLGRGNMGTKAAQDAFAIKPRVIGGVLSSGPVGASVEQKEATKRVYPNAYKKALINSSYTAGEASKFDGARSLLPKIDKYKLNPTAGSGQNPFPNL
jgi:hypothetical protein